MIFSYFLYHTTPKQLVHIETNLKTMKRISRFLFVMLATCVFTTLMVSSAFGHGVGYETLPAQMLGDRKVAMEVNSVVDNATSKREITFSLFDTDTGITLRDITYHVKTIKSGEILFEGNYDAKNGILILDLIADGSDTITTQEKTGGGLFGSLLGTGKNSVEARGGIFKFGGLYRFSIDVLEAEGYSKNTQAPLRFEAGISFPESTTISVDDKYFGRQEIMVITYYELLTGLDYDAKTKSIVFSMPFEWTIPNINQTSVIHQEISIPKTFDTLQVSEYTATVNGMTLSNKSMTVDDFSNDYRIIHLLVYQSELLRLYDQQQNKPDKMDFSLFPKSDDQLLSAVTENVQYKISLRTNPRYVAPGDDVLFLFKIYDIFLHEKTVAVDYDAVIESNGKMLFKTHGKSTGEKGKWNELGFSVPKDVSGKIILHFENLNDNDLARAEIPIIVKQSLVPSFIKNNAEWWCKDSISDAEFLKGIEYLIAHDVIQISQTTQNTSGKEIPPWVKSNACWWANDSITDTEFIDAITFLVKIGLISP